MEIFSTLEEWKDLKNLGNYEDNSERLKQTKWWDVEVIHILTTPWEDLGRNNHTNCVKSECTGVVMTFESSLKNIQRNFSKENNNS